MHFFRSLPAVLLLAGYFLCGTALFSQSLVKGKVINPYGVPLPYASVYIKGNTRGTVANADGQYSLELPAGTYTLVCAYVGYQKTEQKITLGKDALVVNFALNFQQTSLGEVVVKANAEDPAYAIIRNAIRKRPEYLREVEEWQAMVYMKGMIRTYKLPKNILGQPVRVSGDIVDSSGKGIIYFSESLT
nr:DUF5686 and carboxypeptidase regulatory-like domain-containing protein [Chitinophagaceae bacterium]